MKRMIVEMFQAASCPDGLAAAGLHHALLLQDRYEIPPHALHCPHVENAAKEKIAILLQTQIQRRGVVKNSVRTL
jgi:hypothetical protein